MTPGYLSTKNAAAYLDLPVRAFYQAVQRHGIPHGRIGKLLRFKVTDLDAALQAMAQRPRFRLRKVG